MGCCLFDEGVAWRASSAVLFSHSLHVDVAALKGDAVMKQKLTTQSLATMGLLIAMIVVLSRV